MDKLLRSTSALLRFAIILVGAVGLVAAETENTLAWEQAASWQSDGMWSATSLQRGLQFLKDKKPAHNSMCWLPLERPLRRGQSIEITYRMEVPYKHVDMFVGRSCAQAVYGKPMSDFAEVVSLGGIPQTDWRTLRLAIYSDQLCDTLGFLSWGWPVDRNTWMRVAEIAVSPPSDQTKWFTWPVAPHLNSKSIPARCALQDFFPFGVYISIGDCNRAAAREGKGLWVWLDEVLADLKRRGFNFTSMVNFGEANLERLVKLHQKHGLKLNPQVSQFDLKHCPYNSALRKLRLAIAKYRDTGVIAGWAAGEEFPPARVSILDVPHELVHAVDPANTLVTIHNKTQAFEIIGQVADVRIAFRDIYPFFNNPKVGPTTFEASMNYYEDEIDKCRRLLPRGASLWVIPQGQGEYGYIRTPTPAQIKLQAWSAIAHGAQGLTYFVYHSAGEPGKLRFDGLRALDGSPTDRLEALTELARQLVPLGPTIVRWSKSRTPAETDNRSLRAYLFAGEHQEAYAVVYNRNVKEAAAASVRVGLQLGEHVLDLVNPAKVVVQESNGRSVFAVRLKPGEGGIFSLGVKLP